MPVFLNVPNDHFKWEHMVKCPVSREQVVYKRAWDKELRRDSYWLKSSLRTPEGGLTWCWSFFVINLAFYKLKTVSMEIILSITSSFPKKLLQRWAHLLKQQAPQLLPPHPHPYCSRSLQHLGQLSCNKSHTFIHSIENSGCLMSPKGTLSWRQ